MLTLVRSSVWRLGVRKRVSPWAMGLAAGGWAWPFAQHLGGGISRREWALAWRWAKPVPPVLRLGSS